MAMSAIARRLGAGVGFLMVPFISSLPPISAGSAQAAPVAPAPVTVRVQGAPQVPAGATSLGATAPSQSLTGAVALAPLDEAALEAFISAVTDKSSAQYGQYLPAGTFESRFGPLPSTISAVEQAVQADGLHVTGVASDGLLVDFSGNIGQAENTFHTGFDNYHMHAGWTGRGTTGSVQLQLPSSVSSAVTGVLGLNNLVQAESSDIVQSSEPSGASSFPAAKAGPVPSVPGAASACADAQQDATTFGGLTDDQIANAYGAFGLYQQGDFAQGQHVAIYELEPFLASDIETFDTCYFGATEAAQMSGTGGDLTGSRLSVIPVDGGDLQPGPTTQNLEADLDVENVSAIAPEANIDVFEAPNDTFGQIDEYAQIINSDTDQEITSSWGLCEQALQTGAPGMQQEENFLFQQAAAQGQTVLNAAGDTGEDSCNQTRLAAPPAGQNFLSVDDPASQPYVLGVGGTTITDATQPPTEQVWNDGAAEGGGGGGISESWAMPSWQQHVALTATATDLSNAEAVEAKNAAQEAPFATPTFCDGTLNETVPCREVPDVSAQADEFTGAITIYSASLSSIVPSGWVTIGGTSSSAPIWAALLALVNQSSYCSSDLVTFASGSAQDAGFASSILYGIAASPRAYAASFNNVTSGNNDIYGLDNGLTFPARAGYNMASGLGSPKVTSPTGGPGLAYYMCHFAATHSAPVVTKLSPASGSVTGGFTVTITGSGFGSTGNPQVKTVQVGNAQATGVVVDSNTQLTVTLPAAIDTVAPGSPNPTQDGAGPADIVVTNNAGLQAG